jgi:undecaprenyl-diphosphatase
MVEDSTGTGSTGAAEQRETADLRRRRSGGMLDLLELRISILAAGFALAAAALLLFGALAEDVYEREAIVLDANAGYFLHRYSTPGLDVVMRLLTLTGSILVILPVFAVVAGWLLWLRRRVEIAVLSVALVGSVALNQVLKLVFHRPRPRLPWSVPDREFSFPSGHAMNSLVFYLGLALVVWVLYGRGRGLIALGLACALVAGIGASRIYLGYHYLSDVAAGYAAGLVWLLAVAAAAEGRRAVLRWQRRGGAGARRE